MRHTVCEKKDKERVDRMRLDILQNRRYTGNILKKVIGSLGGLLILGLIFGVLYSNQLQKEELEDTIPTVEELLADPSSTHAALLRSVWELGDAQEQHEMEEALRVWIRSSLQSYQQEEISEEEMTTRIQFLQVCGVLEEEAEAWVQEKEKLDAEFRAAKLYGEAYTWYEEGQYVLARESAEMIQDTQSEYYRKAQALLQKCSEKEEEKRAALAVQEAVAKRERVAALYQAYEKMEDAEAGSLVWDAYEQALREISDAQERESVRNQYPLTEWKWACKCLLLGNGWSDTTKCCLLSSQTEIPWLMALEASKPRVFRWSALQHQWIEIEIPAEALEWTYFGVAAESSGFLFGEITQNQERYVWWTLTAQGWEITETLRRERDSEEFWIEDTRVDEEVFEEHLRERMTQCGQSEVVPITGEALTEMLDR